jgi:hypothetical protein
MAASTWDGLGRSGSKGAENAKEHAAKSARKLDGRRNMAGGKYRINNLINAPGRVAAPQRDLVTRSLV